LTGLAKPWYTRNVGSVHGEWEVLQTKFCIAFFPISSVVQLCREVLTFQQKEKETLGIAWARLNDILSSGPYLTIPDAILLQHIYLGLSKETAHNLDIASRG
jgi:hypothetical protein